jgi:hypothetical protein
MGVEVRMSGGKLRQNEEKENEKDKNFGLNLARDSVAWCKNIMQC